MIALLLETIDHVSPEEVRTFRRVYDPPNSGELGGLKAVDNANCLGDPFTVKAFMRTRYAYTHMGAYGLTRIASLTCHLCCDAPILAR
jgi:hypothetical protein